MSDKPEKEEVQKEILIPIVWNNLEDISTAYANELIITHAGNEFFLVFGESFIPIRSIENKEDIPEKINIKPVVKIAITRENMLRFAEAIDGNIEKYLSKQQKENE